MKRVLILLLVLTLVWALAACTSKNADGKDPVAGKATGTNAPEKDKETESQKETETEEVTEPEETEPNLDFEFTYKSLALKVNTVEEHVYDAENDSFDAPQGRYVFVACNILEGEMSTGELSGLYDCLKMNGYEPVNVGMSGTMSLVNGQMYVGTGTLLTFRFDVPEDFDAARPFFTAD